MLIMMPQQAFQTFRGDSIDAAESEIIIDWLWEGYLGRGQLTLLTSQWKAGKTTLLAGLLNQFEQGGTFLGQRCAPAKVLIVSEESKEHWAARRREIPLGPHVHLMPRPFRTRPTPADWQRLVDFALARSAAGELDLLAIDPLAKFLPGSSDSDPATLLHFLDPLQELAAAGVAVLVLHHPRKEAAEEGHTARGSGALLGYVDVILELHRYGKLKSDFARRRLVALSRHRATPASLIYEWTPGTPTFTALPDPLLLRFQDNWQQVHAILERMKDAVTHKELLRDWPEGQAKPSATVLYEWLNRATESKLVRRLGCGTRLEPYCYRLKNEDDDYYDQGKIPPRKLPGILKRLEAEG
jgi:hypothetical protein